MATIIIFEDLEIWQKAREICNDVWLMMEETTLQKDYGLKNQMNTSSGSVMDNIAEGFDRMSDKEFVRFLYIALGSCSEVKSMLYLSNRLNYLSQHQSDELIIKANEVGRIIRGLIKSISQK